MATPNEQIVNPELNKFLDKDLTTSAKRIEAQRQEFDDEEVEDVQVTPVTERTRNQILFYLSRGHGQNTDITKLNALVEKVVGLDERTAQIHLSTLKYLQGSELDNYVVDMFIKNAATAAMNPNAPEYRDAALKDPFIRECVSTGLNELLGQLGYVAGILVFGFYTFASWTVPEKVREILPPPNYSKDDHKEEGTR